MSLLILLLIIVGAGAGMQLQPPSKYRPVDWLFVLLIGWIFIDLWAIFFYDDGFGLFFALTCVIIVLFGNVSLFRNRNGLFPKEHWKRMLPRTVLERTCAAWLVLVMLASVAAFTFPVEPVSESLDALWRAKVHLQTSDRFEELDFPPFDNFFTGSNIALVGYWFDGLFGYWLSQLFMGILVVASCAAAAHAYAGRRAAWIAAGLCGAMPLFLRYQFPGAGYDLGAAVALLFAAGVGYGNKMENQATKLGMAFILACVVVFSGGYGGMVVFFTLLLSLLAMQQPKHFWLPLFGFLTIILISMYSIAGYRGDIESLSNIQEQAMVLLTKAHLVEGLGLYGMLVLILMGIPALLMGNANARIFVLSGLLGLLTVIATAEDTLKLSLPLICVLLGGVIFWVPRRRPRAMAHAVLMTIFVAGVAAQGALIYERLPAAFDEARKHAFLAERLPPYEVIQYCNREFPGEVVYTHDNAAFFCDGPAWPLARYPLVLFETHQRMPLEFLRQDMVLGALIVIPETQVLEEEWNVSQDNLEKWEALRQGNPLVYPVAQLEMVNLTTGRPETVDIVRIISPEIDPRENVYSYDES